MSEKHQVYRVAGIMSGTSLDGLDIAFVEFKKINQEWNFKIIKAITYEYSDKWRKLLQNASELSGFELTKLDLTYGKFIADKINEFIPEKFDLIASHGHTVFHDPQKGMTLQIGNGLVISNITQTITVADFRSKDVINGGQGAPLVPVGDELLFSNYGACLNLGGFSNISFKLNNLRIAFDICPVNIILNELCPPFDKNGEQGRRGNVSSSLLSELNDIEYYQRSFPKSLGREWMNDNLFKIIHQSKIKDPDILRTIYEHIAIQISNVIRNYNIKDVLITGGGAYNTFLIERIRENTNVKLIFPENQVIDYKEAIIFALLGLLKTQAMINCYASVTGAVKDSSIGVIYDC